MKYLILPCIFLIFVSSCLATNIHGTVYDENLDIVENAIVEVDSTPQQRYVAKDGTYSFTLPEGSYTLTTRHDSFVAEEEIVISKEGAYVLDLFLFPSFEEEDELIEETRGIVIEDEYFEEEGDNTLFILLGILVFLGLVALVFYSLRQKKPKIKAGIEDIKEEKDELEKYLDFIKKHGGRTTQKEIRKNFPMSEAKVSLIITELEHKGKIQKIRKGRSNIIILKK